MKPDATNPMKADNKVGRAPINPSETKPGPDVSLVDDDNYNDRTYIERVTRERMGSKLDGMTLAWVRGNADFSLFRRKGYEKVPPDEGSGQSEVTDGSDILMMIKTELFQRRIDRQAAVATQQFEEAQSLDRYVVTDAHGNRYKLEKV